MKLPTETLKQILVKSGFVTEGEFNDAAQSAIDIGRNIDDILIFRGLIDQDNLSKLVAEHLQTPYLDIRHHKVADDVLALIPEKLARKYRVVPLSYDKEKNELRLAMEDPSDFEAIEFVKRHSGLNVTPYYASPEDVKRALGQYKKNIRADFDRVISENIKKVSPGQDLLKAAEDLPIIKVLDTVLEYAVAERSSDIHIETQSEDVIIRFRVDGVLRDIIKLPRGIEDALVARIKILSNLKLDERRIPQDGRYRFNIDEDVIALRISIIPGFYGENVVMRILHEGSRPLSLEELGLNGNNLEIIKKGIRRPNGMVLVTGPTGSGKTTTLYSVLNILNTVKVKICTIEDPVEYGISRVTQIQVNTKTGLTFVAGLRSLLRHDPDIMMVGEIRDKETAEIAVHSALTGHLVISTLHTNNAAGAIPRLIDMGIEGYLIASTLNVLVAQRLVRKICQSCLVEYTPDPGFIERLKQDYGLNMDGQKYYKGKGCQECGGDGFSGRIGIYEVLNISETIREMITKKETIEEIQRQAELEGMTTMVQDGLNKIAGGFTTIEEVLKAVAE